MNSNVNVQVSASPPQKGGKHWIKVSILSLVALGAIALPINSYFEINKGAREMDENFREAHEAMLSFSESMCRDGDQAQCAKAKEMRKELGL